jgi:EpsI family protein
MTSPEAVVRATTLTRVSAASIAAVTLVVGVIALWPGVASLIDDWGRIHDYRHGVLIAAATVIWLGIVICRVAGWPARPRWLGAAVLAVLLFAWLVVWNANSVVLVQLLLPASLWSAIWAAAGFTVARAFFAPLAFFYFAIPVWDHVVPLLQQLSVVATEGMLKALGVPAEVTEYSVSLPVGTFEIVEGCSGKRYFMIAMAFAVLAGAVHHLRWQRAFALVLFAGLVALVANWIRIVIVIYAGHVTAMQSYLVAVEHRTLGNVIFVILLVGVVLLARWLAHRPGAQYSARHAPSGDLQMRWSSALPMALFALLLAATQVRAAAEATAADIGGFPVATDTWQGPLPGARDWAPAFVGAHTDRRAAYVSNDGAVELFLVAYAEQVQGRELIQYSNSLLAPGAWARDWPHRGVALETATPRLVSFEARDPQGRRWVLAYTYDVGGWTTASGPVAQLAYGLRSIRRPAASSMVALAAQCDTNCKAAQARVTRFWDDMSAPILALLPNR